MSTSSREQSTPLSAGPVLPRSKRKRRSPLDKAQPGARQRAPELLGGLGTVQALAVADQHVLRCEPSECSRRERLEKPVHADAIAVDREEAVAAERVAEDQRPLVRPPQRDLLPPAPPQHGNNLERRSREG